LSSFMRATAARLSNPLRGIGMVFLRLRLGSIAAYCRQMQAVLCWPGYQKEPGQP